MAFRPAWLTAPDSRLESRVAAWRFWLLVFAAWTTVAVVFGVSTSLTYVSQDRPPLWGPALAFSLAQWWIWAALTPVVLAVSRRFPLDRGQWLARLPVHVVLGLVVAFVKLTIEGRVRQWLFGAPPYLLLNNLALQFVIYGALVAAAHVVTRYGESQARAAATEASLADARLQLLRAQLQPHFLFNALNAIAELVHEDPERADLTIGRLSDLLRASLDTGARDRVTMADEAALAGAYLDVQRARYGDRLRVSVDIPDDCRAALVPPLILQPLVENAVQHGVAARPDGGSIAIAATRDRDGLRVTVDDDGPGWPGDAPPASGVGLANTRARLASIYGPDASLELRRREGGGVRAAVMLPWEAVRS
jgi:signal transduction histidine kinase